MSATQPASTTELKEYALRKLGKPVVEVNLADEQMDDLIDEAIQYFQEYHFDGTERHFLVELVEASTLTFSSASSNDNMSPSADIRASPRNPMSTPSESSLRERIISVLGGALGSLKQLKTIHNSITLLFLCGVSFLQAQEVDIKSGQASHLEGVTTSAQLKPSETLSEFARRLDVGYDEVLYANPYFDVLCKYLICIN